MQELVSIIIATCNRSADLKRCLAELLKLETQDLFSFNIIIADNNSSDGTAKLVREYQERFPGRFEYIFEPRQGKCFALNAALAKSRAEIVAFTDDDVQADPQWLLEIINCFKAHRCDGVGGRILPDYPASTPGWIKENIAQLAGAIVVYDYGEGTRLHQKPDLEFLGANYAFKRQVFDDCGFFRTDIGPGQGTFGDDTEYINRLLRAGKKLYYCGKATVFHPVDPRRMTLKYIWQWNVALGRYRVIVDEGGRIDNSLIYWFDVPRYLIGRMLRDGLSATVSVFHRASFLNAWINVSRNWGRAMQVRKIRQAAFNREKF